MAETNSPVADRTVALQIADELILIAEVYGTVCRDRVRRALAANPDLHWMNVVDLVLTEWERTRPAMADAMTF